VAIEGQRNKDLICIRVSNPRATGGTPGHQGNQMALDNIRERLALAFGAGAGLQIDSRPDRYQVTLTFPYRP
jgi:LytS/YehU family sensor histidine kinase